jgi:hypothetical protein
MSALSHAIMWVGLHSPLGYFESWVKLEAWAAFYCEEHHPQEWVDG